MIKLNSVCLLIILLAELTIRVFGHTTEGANENEGYQHDGLHPGSTPTDLLSKNISAILENLSQNYDKGLRPGHSSGEPIVITTNMMIRSMGPISELEMEYTMDMYFRQKWRDPRLSFEGPIETLSLNIKMLEGIWKPDTFFHNGKGSYIHMMTRPNKLLRLYKNGRILYSLRLTIKAKCPMELRYFPMDRQSCPLVFGSYAYGKDDIRYEWDDNLVQFAHGLSLSQFDLLTSPTRNATVRTVKGEYSVLQVNFNLQRHTGYFLIQVYVPCILIVVLSWVSFWINREATSDRVGLGITTVLTLSTISLDSKTDLPKVSYATALDWFILLSFGYCIATLLEFAGVHFFTKVGFGEVDQVPWEEDEWEDVEYEEELGRTAEIEVNQPASTSTFPRARNRSTIITTIYKEDDDDDIRTVYIGRDANADSPVEEPICNHVSAGLVSRFRTQETQTERKDGCCLQFLHCVVANDTYKRQRQKESSGVNSVSIIDRVSRVLFPASYGLLNLLYWLSYTKNQVPYSWEKDAAHI